MNTKEVSPNTKFKIFEWDIETYIRLKNALEETQILGGNTDWITTRMEKIQQKYVK